MSVCMSVAKCAVHWLCCVHGSCCISLLCCRPLLHLHLPVATPQLYKFVIIVCFAPAFFLFLKHRTTKSNEFSAHCEECRLQICASFFRWPVKRSRKTQSKPRTQPANNTSNRRFRRIKHKQRFHIKQRSRSFEHQRPYNPITPAINKQQQRQQQAQPSINKQPITFTWIHFFTLFNCNNHPSSISTAKPTIESLN